MAETGRHPNWILAERILSDVLPGSVGFEPDQIATLQPSSWDNFSNIDWEGDDAEQQIVQYIERSISGMLVVVTFVSYLSKCGPFFVDSTSFPRLVELHQEVYDDVFWGSDIVVVVPVSGVVVVVHHSGRIATLKGLRVDLNHSNDPS